MQPKNCEQVRPASSGGLGEQPWRLLECAISLYETESGGLTAARLIPGASLDGGRGALLTLAAAPPLLLASARSVAEAAAGCRCSENCGGQANADPTLPGGGTPQHWDERNTSPAPPHVRQHQLQGISDEYRRRVFADGIPFRPHGLFPPQDPLLRALAADPRLRPFEKHLPGADSPYERLLKGGWTTGDAAARTGLDLRLFYKEPAAGETHGTIYGAVRFGEGACIGNGYWMSAHGGSIESALDEATAELAKLVFVPMVSTREASFSITKPVPLHTSLLITCRIKEMRGLRCYVEGAISSAPVGVELSAGGAAGARSAAGAGSAGGTGGGGGGSDSIVSYATCSALLVNIKDWI